MRKMNQDAIKRIIPHRYENLLLDSEDIYEENGLNRGHFSLTVSQDDFLSRQVFMRKSDSSVEVFIEPAYMEILALAAIVSMGELPEGVTCFFSAITNYKKMGDIAINEALFGEVAQGKAKGDFHRFSGQILSSGGKVVAEGDLMAFAMKITENMPEADKKQMELPVSRLSEPVTKAQIGWKWADLVFADQIDDMGDSFINTSYTYPDDHIFTKGHFPGNPVMMGINQWIAGADALWLFIQKQLAAGKIRDGRVVIEADVDIAKSDGVITSEIKGLSCSAFVSGGVLGPLSVDATRKLYFRDVVKPADKLFIMTKNVVVKQ